MQMNCLDTFCISHFKKKDNFIQIKDKGLLFDKVDFPLTVIRSMSTRFPPTLTKQLLLVVRERRKSITVLTLLKTTSRKRCQKRITRLHQVKTFVLMRIVCREMKKKRRQRQEQGELEILQQWFSLSVPQLARRRVMNSQGLGFKPLL